MKSRSLCNIYMGLWCLYYLQGTLYEVGSIMSRVSLAILLLMSLYGFFMVARRQNNPKPLKILTILVICWTIYGIMPILFGTGATSKVVEPFRYLKDIYISVLPIFTFYWFGKKGALLDKDLKLWYPVILIVLIALYYYDMHQSLESMKAGADGVTNNSGYYILAAIPLLALFEKKAILQYAFLAIIMAYVLMSFKRGAIVVGTISSIYLILISLKNKESKKKKVTNILKRFLLTAILVVGVVFAIQYLMMTSDYFNFRLEQTLEGNSSGREDIYGYLYNYFINKTGVFEFIFGYGAYGTLKVFENYAHNDWLEIAIDNGLIVLCIFAFYWISLIRYYWKSDRNSTIAIMLALFILVYFVKSFFSMSFNQTPPFAACALGYALANLSYTGKRGYNYFK